MNNLFGKNIIDRIFKQVDDVVWDMMTGKVGFKTNEGIVTIDLGLPPDSKVSEIVEAEDAQVSINLLEDFGMPIPAFAQSVPVDSISLGDMIYSSAQKKVVGWVVKKSQTGKSFKVMKQDGTRSDWTPPKVQMIGFDSGVMVLRSLMNMLPGGQAGLGQFQSALMPMMMMGMMGDGESGNDAMSQMIPMMLMTQTGANGLGAGDPSAMGNMMQTMMLMQMMKGNKPSGRTTGSSSKTFFD